jgi:hypothetical protein
MRSIDKLIDEYKEMVKNCHQVDYEDKKALKRNNDSVTRMYDIIDKVRKEFGDDGIEEFKKLLDIQDYRTNLWAATHLLEKTTLDKSTEDKALSIIENIASGDDATALGSRYWIKDWKSKRNK